MWVRRSFARTLPSSPRTATCAFCRSSLPPLFALIRRGADELWEGVMEQWFYNQFHTISNNMRIYNRRQREEATRSSL